MKCKIRTRDEENNERKAVDKGQEGALVSRMLELEYQKLPDYDSYTLNRQEKRKYFFTAGSSLFLLGFLFYKSIPIALFFILAARPLRKVWEAHLAEKRKEELCSQFRDLLYGLSASVSAGRQLPQALSEAGAQLEESYGREAVLCCEVRYMVRSTEESLASLEPLLKEFARRSHIKEIRQFVQVCTICKQTGGDLERVIGKTASVLMEKIAVKREIQMVTAQKRLESCLLTAMPVAMVLMLNLLSPDYLSVLYTSLTGHLVMTAALTGMALAYVISQKITAISV